MSQTASAADTLVAAYLTDLRAAASRLPAPAAHELISDVSHQIAAARAGSDRATEVAAVLHRLGPPAALAAARQLSALSVRPKPGAPEWVGLGGLFASLFIPILSTLAGLVLVSGSPVWTPRQRAMAWIYTFAPLTLLAPAPLIFGAALRPYHLVVAALFVLIPCGSIAAAIVLTVQLQRTSRD